MSSKIFTFYILQELFHIFALLFHFEHDKFPFPLHLKHAIVDQEFFQFHQLKLWIFVSNFFSYFIGKNKKSSGWSFWCIFIFWFFTKFFCLLFFQKSFVCTSFSVFCNNRFVFLHFFSERFVVMFLFFFTEFIPSLS